MPGALYTLGLSPLSLLDTSALKKGCDLGLPPPCGVVERRGEEGRLPGSETATSPLLFVVSKRGEGVSLAVPRLREEASGDAGADPVR